MFRAGEASLSAVVDAARTARFLIPLIAVAGEEGSTESGLRVDKTQELSIVTVQAPDERAALPVFTSTAAMTAWNPAARPVPADGVRVALAAAGEGTQLVVIDPGNPSELVLRRPALWAMAKSEGWLAPHQNPRLLEILQRAVALDQAIQSVIATTADPMAKLAGAELEVRLVLSPGLDREAVNVLLERVTTEWYADAYFAEAVDTLGISLVPAS